MLKLMNYLVAIVTFFLSFQGMPVYAQDTTQSEPEVIISGIKTGGSGTTDQEFVELYNQSDVPVSLKGWQVRYAAKDTTGTGVAKVSIPLNSTLSIEPNSYFLAATSSFASLLDPQTTYTLFSAGFSDTAGHIILVNDVGLEVDRIGWGTASYPLIQAIPSAHLSGSSIKRCITPQGLFSVSRNNFTDFRVVNSPLLLLPGPPCVPEETIELPESPDVPKDEEPVIEPPLQPTLTCEGIVLSELLPNPSGSDTGREFIELHNPTNEVIELNGCSLQTSANSKIYNLDILSMQPGSYLAFSDTTSGLTLPNAAGGTVWLLSPHDEISTVTYPGNIIDDVAWALISDVWQSTFIPTPGDANIAMPQKPCATGQERNPETGLCRTIPTETVLTPCREGQERNPETNRCRNIISFMTNLFPCNEGQERSPETNRCRGVSLSVSTLNPCRQGQIRNPDTNRCRNVLAATNTLIPCKVGQERSPETNRCRNIANASLASCKIGQERNPDTNRCRKIQAVQTTASVIVEDIPAPIIQSSRNAIIAIAAVVGGLGYALYEWRKDVQNLWFTRKSNASFSKIVKRK